MVCTCAGFISDRIITSVLEFIRFLYVFMISVDKKRLAVPWSKKASFKDIASKRFQVPGLSRVKQSFSTILYDLS